MNPLGDSKQSRFFKVANPDDVGISTPAFRHGDAVTVWARSLTEMQKEALVLSKRTGACWRLASDEGAYLNGLDEAPCPLAFMTTGMVASFMNEIQALLQQRGVRHNGLRLVQDSYYTMEGSMLSRTMVGGALPVELNVEIDADLDSGQLTRLIQDAVAAAPVNGLIRGSLTSLFTLMHNNVRLSLGKSQPLDRPPYPDPGDHFPMASPDAGVDCDDLLARNGMSPATDEITSRAGSSFADEQSRRLHVRGICSVDDDGMKRIEQQLFNPHGSIFHFQCEEAPVYGGQGRAPDANSYIAAGIGFCFMTQLGRFANIMKKELRDYRIIQDMHFSLGGASGNTGKAGVVDAVETHVYLHTPHDAEFARDILDMAERTCFLHALCRTELKARVRLV